MKINAYKSSPIIFGIILLILSAILIVFPGLLSGMMMVLISIVLILFGGLKVLSFVTDKKQGGGLILELVSGGLTLAVGLMLHLSQNVRTFLFGLACAIWLLINGMSKIKIAMDMKNNSFKNWKWIFIIGILNCALGIAIAVNPILGVIGVGYIVQITLAVQGISIIATSLAN